MSACATALALYREEFKRYPPWSADPATNVFGPLAGQSRELARQPTFAILTDEIQTPTLTTPIAFMSAPLPADPFAPAPGATYCYCVPRDADGQEAGWLLWSAGPDGDYDIASHNVAAICAGLAAEPRAGPVQTQYDPTNGSVSDGDIARFGP